MSSSQISPVYDLGTRADYLEFGTGEKKAQHAKEGTNRLAPGYYCDAESIEAFLDMGNALAAQYGRKVKAQSIILSFAPDELDVDDPSDLQRAGDLGFLLAKRTFPNSPCLVVVHDDSDGRNAHAHITILNHDLVSLKAPTKNRTHSQLKRINDQLMRDEGMRVISPNPGGTSGQWSLQRQAIEARVDAGEPKRYEAFYLALGDQIAAAKKKALQGDLDAFMDTFEAECVDRGVSLTKTQHAVKTDARPGFKKGDIVPGLTYSMLDEQSPTKRPRNRRRAASKLSSEFTLEGLQLDVERERQRRILEAQRAQDAQRAQTAAQRRQSLLDAMAQVPTTTAPTVAPGASFAEQVAAMQARQAEMQRQLDELKGTVTPSLATAPDEPPTLATAPVVEGEAETDHAALTAAPDEPSSLASAPDERPTGFRSRLWDYPAKTSSERDVADRLAALDEAMTGWREAGQRPDESVVKAEKIGVEKLSKYGSLFDPENERQLRARNDKLARAKKFFESGDETGQVRARYLRQQVADGIYESPSSAPARQQTIREAALQMVSEPELEVHHETGLER